MKLTFSGEARYPDYDAGYRLCVKRCRIRLPLEFSDYKRIIKRYCVSLAERLYDEGVVDIPGGFGQLAVAEIWRKPQYRGDKFIGYGQMNWNNGHYDGSPKAFGVVFLPNRSRSQNLRSYGFVANRALFKRLKARYEDKYCPWVPLEFNDEMI